MAMVWHDERFTEEGKEAVGGPRVRIGHWYQVKHIQPHTRANRPHTANMYINNVASTMIPKLSIPTGSISFLVIENPAGLC